MFNLFRRKASALSDKELAVRLNRLYDQVTYEMGKCELMKVVQAQSPRGEDFEKNKYRYIEFNLFCIRHVVQAAIVNRGMPDRLLSISDAILQSMLRGMNTDMDEFDRLETALEAAMQKKDPPGYAYWFGKIAIGYIFAGLLDYRPELKSNIVSERFTSLEGMLTFALPLQAMIKINDRFNKLFL